MKRGGLWVMGLVMGLLLTACGSQAPAKSSTAPAPAPTSQGQPSEPTVRLVLTSASPQDMEDTRALLLMKDNLAKATNGKVQLDLHFNSELYDEVAGVKALLSGNVDMAISCTCNLTSITKAYSFADLPYIYKSVDSAKAVWEGPVGTNISEQVHKQWPIRALAYAPSGGGFRILFTQNPVKVPADLSGVKIRTTTTPIEKALWGQWGASPTAIDVGEVYPALQQGLVNGFHVQPWWALALRWYERAKYATEIKSEAVYRVLLISDKAYNKLSPDQQKALMQAADQFKNDAYKLNQEEETKGIQLLKEKGVVFYTPTSQELAQWETTGKAVWKDPAVASLVPDATIQTVLKAQS